MATIHVKAPDIPPRLPRPLCLRPTPAARRRPTPAARARMAAAPPCGPVRGAWERGGFAAVRDRRGTVSCLNDQSGKERFRGFGILRLTVSLYTPVYAHYEHQFDIYIFSTDLTKPVLHHHAAQGVSCAANGLPVVRNG